MGLACRPGVVQQHGQDGPGQGGGDRDQGDLPAGHAAPGDEGHAGRGAAGAAVGRRQRLGEGSGRGGQGQHGAGQGGYGGEDAPEGFHDAPWRAVGEGACPYWYSSAGGLELPWDIPGTAAWNSGPMGEAASPGGWLSSPGG